MALTYPVFDPVAFSVGPLPVRWYALAYMAGFILGWLYAMHIAGLDRARRAAPGRPRLVTRDDIDDFLPWAVLGVILGGRIGYVLFYQFGMYLTHPLEILKVWNGGMSFHGGALGVIIAMIVYALRRKIDLLRLTDIVCAVVPIGLFFGRVANFINGELFGRVTASPLGMVFPGGGPEPRHPSQLYEAVLEGIVLAALLAVLAHMRAVRERPGLVSGLFLIGYAASRSVVELFREPDRQIGFIMDMFTMGQLLSLPMALGGLYLVVRAVLRPRQVVAGAADAPPESASASPPSVPPA